MSSGNNSRRWGLELNAEPVNAAPSALSLTTWPEEEQDNLKPDANTATEGDLRRRRRRKGVRKRSVRRERGVGGPGSGTLVCFCHSVLWGVCFKNRAALNPPTPPECLMARPVPPGRGHGEEEGWEWRGYKDVEERPQGNSFFLLNHVNKMKAEREKGGGVRGWGKKKKI